MNQLITKQKVEDILNHFQNIGDNNQRLSIRKLEYYQTAFVNKTYLLQPDPVLNYIARESYETLEFIGDGFIGASVGYYLKHRFAPQQEGFLTKLKTRLVRTEMLCEFARVLGIGDYILLSPKVEQFTQYSSNKGRNNPAIYEDVFEAFCGAVVDDFGDEEGYRYVKRFTISIIEHVIDFAHLIMNNENHKDTLQRYFQSLKWPNPVYKDLEEVRKGGGHEYGLEVYKKVVQDLGLNIPNIVERYEQLQKDNTSIIPDTTQKVFKKKIFVRGVFITKEQFKHFPSHVQKRIKEFNDLTKEKSSQLIVDNMKLFGEDGYLIGKGKGAKRIEAEQECARNALLLCDIDLNW